MKKGIVSAITVLVLVAVVAGAVLLYNHLKEKYGAENLVVNSSQEETAGDAKPSRDESRQKAPDFTVYDAEGKAVKLSDFRGKPVVLNLWASWCPPCKAELPDFDSAQKKHPDIQFMMVAVTDGERETVETAAAYVEKEGYAFPVFFDTEQEAAVAYSANSIPRTFFVDGDGRIAAYAVGAIEAEALEEGIGRLK